MKSYKVKNNILPLKTALRLQLQALQLEPFAPYVHNEIGNLYLWMNKPDSARHHYILATELAPSWYLPWSNLTGLYNTQKKYQDARKAATEARKLKPATIKFFFANEAVTDEIEGNFLRAAESHVQAIDANPYHYFPYERLGYIYNRTARYQLADSMFYEADLRKQGYYFPGPQDSDNDGIPSIMEVEPPMPPPTVCEEFELPEPGEDPDLYLVHAMHLLDKDNLRNKPDTALVLNVLWKGLQFAPLHPLLNYQIARLLKLQNYLVETLPYLEQSYKGMGKIFMPYDSLTALTEKWEKHQNIKCLKALWKKALIERTDVGFQLMGMYERLGYMADALSIAKGFTLAEEFTEAIMGWQQMARLHEVNGHYESAWQCWQTYKQQVLIKSIQLTDKYKMWYYDDRRMLGVVDDFLLRMLEVSPMDTLWLQRAGTYFYEVVASSPADYIYNDSAAEKEFDGLPSGNRGLKNWVKKEVAHSFEEANLIWKPRAPFPYKNALRYLKLANESTIGAENLYTSFGMMANLHKWAGNTDKALENLRAQLLIMPHDAQVMLEVALKLQELKQTYASFLYLDTLFGLQKLKPVFWPTFGIWAVYANHKASWQSLLQTASQFYYSTNDSLYYIQGIGYLLTQPEKAIPFFTQKMARWMTDAEVKYTVACIYAKLGKSKMALQTLRKALNAGFEYGHVLMNDTTWLKYRNRSSWKKMISGYSFKEYAAGQMPD
jgi:tetratricopeptide (TPR) repeat protein